ncbi:hypothetical protein B296_00043616 [Ensete ventricosum]|uniref:Uncharacterized protein n=1 Tax=Ensete ventricosum TaxID=4639 RepID=A0A426Y959_ENSVE|nr:hypothetical protein B296_00043616 [Ensete ventricosum]
MAIYAAAIGRHCSIQLQPLDRVRGTPTGRPLRRAAVITVARKAIEGFGDELNAVAAENMDFAPARRRVRSAFADVHRRLDHFLFKVCAHPPSPLRCVGCPHHGSDGNPNGGGECR